VVRHASAAARVRGKPGGHRGASRLRAFLLAAAGQLPRRGSALVKGGLCEDRLLAGRTDG